MRKFNQITIVNGKFPTYEFWYPIKKTKTRLPEYPVLIADGKANIEYKVPKKYDKKAIWWKDINPPVMKTMRRTESQCTGCAISLKKSPEWFIYTEQVKGPLGGIRFIKHRLCANCYKEMIINKGRVIPKQGSKYYEKYVRYQIKKIPASVGCFPYCTDSQACWWIGCKYIKDCPTYERWEEEKELEESFRKRRVLQITEDRKFLEKYYCAIINRSWILKRRFFIDKKTGLLWLSSRKKDLFFGDLRREMVPYMCKGKQCCPKECKECERKENKHQIIIECQSAYMVKNPVSFWKTEKER